MIVLDEDGRVGRAELGVHGGGEARVDVLVGCPVLGAELRPHVDDVTERPQPFVGEPAVVGGERRLLEPEPAQRVRRSVGRNAHVIGGIDHERIRRTGPVRDPHAAPLPHQRIERDGDAAGRGAGHNRAVARFGVQIGFAVGDHHERPWLVRVDLVRPRQPLSKRDRPDDLVDGDEAHEQQLHLRAPARKLRRHHRREPERDACLGDEAGPRVLADALVEPGERPADPEAGVDEPEPDHREGDRDVPDGGERVEPERGADRGEEDDEHRRRAALHGRAQRIALRHRQILDHQPRGDRRQERLELLRAPTWLRIVHTPSSTSVTSRPT